MSALLPKADTCGAMSNVCFGPLASISPYSIILFIPGCPVIPRFPKPAAAFDGLKLGAHLSM
jgi:hypothetical protein